MCSLLTLVNPTVLNIWKLIRDLNISYNKKKIVIVYVTPNPKIRGLKCYQCAIASRASQSTELGTVCMYVSVWGNTEKNEFSNYSSKTFFFFETLAFKPQSQKLNK